MTITYDSEDLWFVLTNLDGSIWPRVLPYCITNVALAAAIWYLRNAQIIDLTFDNGSAGGILNVVVAFFVVTEVNINYGRFWEARGHLGKARTDIRIFTSRLKTFTGLETHAKAREWRSIVKDRVLRLVQESFHDVQCGNIAHTAFRGETSDVDAEAEKAEKSLRSTLVGEGADNSEHNLFYDKYDLNASVQAAVMSNKDFLETPLTLYQVIGLLGQVNSFVECYQNLAKFSMTPIPFPFVQMGRTLLLLWLYHLPFVLLYDCEYVRPALVVIFIITFAFMGLASVSIELSDPLGNDKNDLDIKRFARTLHLSITHDLEDDCDNMFDWNEKHGGITPQIREYVGHHVTTQEDSHGQP